MADLTNEQKIQLMTEWGFHIRERDPRLNTDYSGSLMVVEGSPEEIERDYELPTRDGADGPWCLVGDDRQELIDDGYAQLVFLEPPGFAERLAEIQKENHHG